jgi:hypothetical protein
MADRQGSFLKQKEELRSMSSEGRVKTSVCFDLDDYSYLKHLAKSKGLSFASVSRLAVKEWIASRKKKAQETKQS